MASPNPTPSFTGRRLSWGKLSIPSSISRYRMQGYRSYAPLYHLFAEPFPARKASIMAWAMLTLLRGPPPRPVTSSAMRLAYHLDGCH
jgi:hypothetical protein